MSQKITGKNLHYDQSLPPFLARLKGQHAIDADSPDPILASRRRAAKPRSASEDAEDAPLIVDDDGNVVSGMKIGVDGAVTGQARDDDGADEGDGAQNTVDGEKSHEHEQDKEEKVAAIGGSKKRKVGKVVGADAEDEVADDIPSTKAKHPPAHKSDTSQNDAARKTKEPAKSKKKAKKIKLSFGDDDGD